MVRLVNRPLLRVRPAAVGTAALRFVGISGSDARLIVPTPRRDDRGGFHRSWCAADFADAGIDFRPVQGNSSFTRRRGTIRGMHFQRAPRGDAKIVRCSRGRIHDVIVDLRVDAATFGMAYDHVLTDDPATMLYVPAGFAHGFQTLVDDVIVEYLMGDAYVPELYDGCRYDDPALGLHWPLPVAGLSSGDAGWRDLAARLPGFVRGVS